MILGYRGISHQNTSAVSKLHSFIKLDTMVHQVRQVFLDVVESINLMLNSNGSVVSGEVVGALKMRTYLSGMPECKLGLNDRVLMESTGRGGRGKSVEMDDVKFHQCVRY